MGDANLPPLLTPSSIAFVDSHAILKHANPKCEALNLIAAQSSRLFANNTKTEQKKKYALESLEFNCRNPAFRKLFPDLVELHERRKQEAVAAGAAVRPSFYSVLR